MKGQAVKLTAIVNRDGTRKFWYYEYGRKQGQRIASEMFTYVSPKDRLEKQHNKEIEGLLNTSLAQRYLDLKAGKPLTNSRHRADFLKFFEHWVKTHSREGNRHALCCFMNFREFIMKECSEQVIKNKDKEVELPADRVTYETCLRFQQYLTESVVVVTESGVIKKKPRLTGETPMNYFTRFRKMMEDATQKGYFNKNPAESLMPKKGRDNKPKDVLTPDELTTLIKFPCANPAVKKAFLFCSFTGIRGQSVRSLEWGDINEAEKYMFVVQDKTGNKIDVPLVQEAMSFLPIKRGKKEEKVFDLPTTTNGCNKMLKQWVTDAGIDKTITFHCARHYVGTTLKMKGASIAQIADTLGQKSTKSAEIHYTRMTDLENRRDLLKSLFKNRI